MLYLTKKMLRDLWNMKTQFIAVLLMSFFAVFMYTGLEGVWFGMLNYAEEWFEDSNTADAWVQGYMLNDSDIRLISDMENIENVQAVAAITGEMRYGEEYAQLLLMASNKDEISVPTVTSGEAYNPTGTGIWLFEAFAEAHSIVTGDTITIGYNDNSTSLEVRGLILSPENMSYTGSSATVTPDYMRYGYGYISPATIEKLTDEDLAYTQIKIVYTKDWDSDKEDYVALDDEAIERIRVDIEHELGHKYLGYSDRSDNRGISSFTDKFKQVRGMTILFAVLLTLLAMLTMQTTMRRMIEIQRIQIGTLKAIGYKNWMIRLHFLFYGFWVSILGGVLGLLIAPVTISEALLSMQKDFYSVPEWSVRNSALSIVLLVAVVLICSVTSLIASRKGTKGMPAITMRDEPPKTRNSIMLERFTGLWNFLSYEWRWTLRVIARNKARTIIGVIGIIGSVTLLIDSFGLYNSLKFANDNLYGTQFDYGAKITLKSSATDDDKSELYDLANSNAQWVQEMAVDIRTSSERGNSVIQIYDSGYFYHFENLGGSRIALPKEGVAISRQLAGDLGVHENDMIQFRLAGQEQYITALVSEIITPATPQGLFLSVFAWHELGGVFEPNVLLVNDPDIASEAAKLSYVSEAITLETQLEQADEVLHSILMIIVMLMAGALLLSVIILYNLGVLSFTERSREYATLKVIGYRDKEIKSFIRHDNRLQLFMGLILGIPVGYAFLSVHIGLASTSTFEYTAHLNPLYLILTILIMCVLTSIISSVVSRKALKLNMVEALKSIE